MAAKYMVDIGSCCAASVRFNPSCQEYEAAHSLAGLPTLLALFTERRLRGLLAELPWIGSLHGADTVLLQMRCPDKIELVQQAAGPPLRHRQLGPPH